MGAFRYFAEIERIAAAVQERETEQMERAVALLTEAIAAKRSIWAFGASHAGILTEELFYRAGGLMVINPIFARELMLDTEPVSHTSRMERLPGYGVSVLAKYPINTGDVVLVHSVSGRNPVSIEVATEAAARGATVIAVTNLTYSKSVTSRHPSGKRLFEVAHLVLDNHGEQGDACVAVPGMAQKVAPSSTVIGAMMLNAIVAETVERLVEGGMSVPPVFYSANVDGGDEKNKALVHEYRDCIHYRF